MIRPQLASRWRWRRANSAISRADARASKANCRSWLSASTGRRARPNRSWESGRKVLASRLAAVDATLEQWREVLETAMRFAADCAEAYRRASRRTRRLFNQAVLDRIEVCDRKLASVNYQAPFDLLFNTSRFEYDAVVAPTGFEPALPP
jgi:hypothetical protein